MTGMTALLGFTGWMLLLMAIIVSWRVVEILRGKPATSWTRGAAIESPGLVKRAEHAHLNTLENLPIFAVLVLAAQAMNQSAAVDGLAAYVLYARIGQSVIHLIGVTHWLVMLRAGFFAAQYVLFVLMLCNLAC